VSATLFVVRHGRYRLVDRDYGKFAGERRAAVEKRFAGLDAVRDA
jgi:hypothetical protein